MPSSQCLCFIGALSLFYSSLFSEGITVNQHELKNLGEPKSTGTIYFYPQHHRLFEERFSEYVEDSDFCSKVADSQFKILRQLKHLGCRAIFSEEHLEKMTLEDANPTDIRTVQFYFDEGIPRNVSELQKAVLYEYGAAFVYLCLKPKVTIYPTIRPEDHLFINHLVQRALEKGQELPSLAYEDREILALEEIQAYLKKRPGERVALIYGHFHKFFRHIGETFNPKFLVYNGSR